MKSAPDMAESRLFAAISTSSLRSLLPKSISSSTKHNKRSKSNSENAPPPDPNVVRLNEDSHFAKSPPTKSVTSIYEINRVDASQEVPRNQEVVKLESESTSEGLSNSDPAVKVVVRVKPGSAQGKEGARTVKRVSSNTLCIGERKFTFDSVLDSNSSQEDVFETVGAPLVRSALAGYNTSLLSYGQSGSGKTYTMWGPPSSMVDDPAPNSQQGIVPRIFHMLFSEIEKEQKNPEGKHINYQCRCSFLEVYNEQIGDLLDPSQRNLEIKDDPKNGLYVDSLSEEYVTSYEDVTQILIKGLSSRKVGATAVNSKSSRSHIVFTFVVESWCKGTSSKHFSSSKTSRISLVDLAGLDNNNTDDGKYGVKESRNVKKSLAKLGYLVHTLNEKVDQSKDVPYKASCLTHILRDSLGGNAKLTVVCNISPDMRHNGETLSTLRFGQQIKSITNEPVINEISSDDVNDLSDQIRQLKEELIRAKSDVCYSEERKTDYFKGRNIRDSLNQLRVSLNRSLMLPRISDDDHEEEVYMCEDDVKELREQLENLHNSCEQHQREDQIDERDSIQSSVKENYKKELMDDDSFYNCLEENELEEVDLDKSMDELPCHLSTTAVGPSGEYNSFRTSISISPHRESSSFQEPTLSESPKIGNTQRKSVAFASTLTETHQSENTKPEELHKSLKHEPLRSSLRSSKIFPGSTDSLAVSLQRGLQIIDHHKRISDAKSSSLAFSFEHLTLKPCPDADRANASNQTIPEDGSFSDAHPLFCSSCKQKLEVHSNEVQDSSTVAVNEAGHKDTKDTNNTSPNGTEKAKELQRVCMEQKAKIEELNLLVGQYRREKDLSATEPDHGENSLYLEGPNTEHKQLASSQLEVIKEKCEVEDVKEVMALEGRNSYLNENEKEALLLEIQTLRNKLQSYTATTNRSTDDLRSSLLSRSFKLNKSVDTCNNSGEELDKERQRWTEMESEWICLTDELRLDLESNRQHTERLEMELKSEKKYTEELDDALHRSVLGHARMVEHYVELQEKYNELVLKHRAIMEGIAEVKRAAAKAGAKGHGAKFAKSLAAELSAVRVERERERDLLKKENNSLRIQLRDTAEAVHAAGELLVRLREAEQTASAAEDNLNTVQQENEKLKKQVEKLKRKHKMEMITMKQYLAESKLPESALQPLYREDSDIAHSSSSMIPDDDQAWRAEFGAIYQEHY